MPTLDTLKLATTLERSGFSREQASALSTAVADYVTQSYGELATREQLDVVREQLNAVREQLDAVREQLDDRIDSTNDRIDRTRDQLRSEIASGRDQIRSEIATLSATIQAKLAEDARERQRYTLAQIIALVGLAAAVMFRFGLKS